MGTEDISTTINQQTETEVDALRERISELEKELGEKGGIQKKKKVFRKF